MAEIEFLSHYKRSDLEDFELPGHSNEEEYRYAEDINIFE